MNARPVPGICFLIAAACLLATSGCSIWPEAKADPTRFYVLSTTSAGGVPQPGAPVVHLRDIELANYLRARPVVVRRGNNEVEFREFARWGEPLDLGIGRVLREELMGRGAVRAVLAGGGRREHVGQDYTLTVRVLAAEGLANGSVAFRAIWELNSTGAKPEKAAGGDYQPTDLRWDGTTEASLAAQLSQAVAGLAAEVSAALTKK